MAESAYIHVPFCLSKCHYCDFASQAGRTELIPAWFSAVKNEIAAVGEWASARADIKKPLKTIYIGGGTPSIVSPELIAKLLDTLESEFGLSDQCEITMEANPGTLKQNDLRQLASAGINRISLGLQSSQPRLLKLLGRIHSPGDFINSVTWAAKAGISRISADIMLGLPGQTLTDIDDTLDLLSSLPVGHVSYYSLIVEEGTPFYKIYSGHPELLPDDILEREMYGYTIDRLQGMGFEPYEISSAAVKGEQCRHNLVYWHADPYYGFGPAAHSYLADARRGNTGSLDMYLKVWSAKNEQNNPFLAVTETETINEMERRKETMLLGLRLLEGVGFAQFKSRHGVEMADIFQNILVSLNKRGLIEIDTQGVRLSRAGLDLANQVFMEFV
jgi:oxygen-independent coproporphyrinogen-3 oxidase